MNVPSSSTPTDGTTRGKGDATPGLILRDSLITAVYQVSAILVHWSLAEACRLTRKGNLSSSA
jgi:hypothetical protein